MKSVSNGKDHPAEDDPLLLHLIEQVAQIAERVERLDGAAQRAGLIESIEHSVFRFDMSEPRRQQQKQGATGPVRTTRPPLPDPRLVRQIIRQRQLRARYFDNNLFADPAWDMLLDLTAARGEHSRVSVTSLCIASGVPPTTALRWISEMSVAGLLHRVEDDVDRRRAFITLSDKAVDAISRFFADLGRSALKMV